MEEAVAPQEASGAATVDGSARLERAAASEGDAGTAPPAGKDKGLATNDGRGTAEQDLHGNSAALGGSSMTAGSPLPGKSPDMVDVEDFFGPVVQDTTAQGVNSGVASGVGHPTAKGVKPPMLLGAATSTTAADADNNDDLYACDKDLAACGACGQGWAQRPKKDALSGSVGAGDRLGGNNESNGVAAGGNDAASMVFATAATASGENRSNAKATATGKTGPSRRIVMVMGGIHAKAKAATKQTQAAPGSGTPRIHISETHISDVSLCNVGTPTQQKKSTPRPPKCIILKSWILYDLAYSHSHSRITPKDVTECLDASFRHKDVAAAVHLVRTRDTKGDEKDFKTTFDVWVKPTEDLADDDYLALRLSALDATVHDVVQHRTWKTASNNEHAQHLKVTFSLNNSTVDTPEFLITGFNADTHGTSRQQL